tara:strand:+ start:211 stop:318 length:108 start_codon:yes stop_codon:yes gene_type:complete
MNEVNGMTCTRMAYANSPNLLDFTKGKKGKEEMHK